MYLQAPKLDDRTFQDIVDEAKRRIPRYCPQWTNHNVSDPGITIVELFAWMTELYLYRLNQVPDKSLITFLDLMGVRLRPASAARGDVTFTLAAPADAARPIVIPAGLEVATARTEAEEAIIYTTLSSAEVAPATVCRLLTTVDGVTFDDRSEALTGTARFEIWPAAAADLARPPHPPQALYLGFDGCLDAHRIVLQLECERAAIGIDPLRPAWSWEVFVGGPTHQWQEVAVDGDSTNGLNQNGEITLSLPYQCAPLRLNDYAGQVWLRCSPLDDEAARRNGRPYIRSPRLLHVSARTVGITVPVIHALPVSNEQLGISSGRPGQTFALRNRNVLDLEGPDEVIEVEGDDGAWEPWERVPDFGDSQVTPARAARHYVFDPVTARVEFGPAIRRRDGTEPQFGAVPPIGQAIRIRRYRVGGGIAGNVAAGRVTVLKTSVAGVAGVLNRADIVGGKDVQTLEDVKLQGPKILRGRLRAVTADDFERLAQEVEGVGRVRCLQPRPEDPGRGPGTVILLALPRMLPLEGEQLERLLARREEIRKLPMLERQQAIKALEQELTLPDECRERLGAFLDERRLLTTRVIVRAPVFFWIYSEITIKLLAKADPQRVQHDVQAALHRYLHPLYGGPEERGWPFGQALTIDKVYARIQQVRGVEYARTLELSRMGEHAQPQRIDQVLELPDDGVVVSFSHNVRVE